MSITNESIAASVGTILSNDDHMVQTPSPMAGRVEQSQSLREVLGRAGRSIVTVSAPLGAGKTFFLDRVFAQEIEAGFPERTNRQEVLASNESACLSEGESILDRMEQNFRKASIDHARVLVVEELDRKVEFDDLIWTLEQGLAWIADQTRGVLILTGDRFIEHPAVVERVAASRVRTTAIELEPLDRSLMVDALALRFAQTVLLRVDEEALETAREAAETVLRYREIETTVLPPAIPPIANFREAFGLLQQMADKIKRSTHAVDFPADLVTRVAPTINLLIDQLKVDAWVVEQVRKALFNEEQMSPITEQDILEIAGFKKIDQAFRDGIVEPLVRNKVLLPMGIPYLGPNGEDPTMDFPGPFLPRQETYLRAWVAQYQTS